MNTWTNYLTLWGKLKKYSCELQDNSKYVAYFFIVLCLHCNHDFLGPTAELERASHSINTEDQITMGKSIWLISWKFFCSYVCSLRQKMCPIVYSNVRRNQWLFFSIKSYSLESISETCFLQPKRKRDHFFQLVNFTLKYIITIITLSLLYTKITFWCECCIRKSMCWKTFVYLHINLNYAKICAEEYTQVRPGNVRMWVCVCLVDMHSRWGGGMLIERRWVDEVTAGTIIVDDCWNNYCSLFVNINNAYLYNVCWR